GGKIADKADEISFGRIERAEAGRILLASLRVGIHSDSLQGESCHNVLVTPVGVLGVNPAPHIFRLEPWRLLVDEGHKPHRARRMRSLRNTRQLQKRSHTAGVIVSAWTIAYGVIVSADNNDLLGPRNAGDLNHQVANLSPLDHIFLRLHLVPL